MLEHVDMRAVWPYVKKHFRTSDRWPNGNMKTEKGLLIAVTQEPGSPLYEDFMKALSKTYPNLYKQMQKDICPSEDSMEDESGYHSDLKDQETDKNKWIKRGGSREAMNIPITGNTSLRDQESGSHVEQVTACRQEYHLYKYKNINDNYGRSKPIFERNLIAGSGCNDGRGIKRQDRAYECMMDDLPLELRFSGECADPFEVDIVAEETHLSFTFNGEDTMTHIIQQVRELAPHSLFSFALRNNYISLDDALELGPMLAHHRNLRELRIEDNFTTTGTLRALIRAIVDMPRLVLITLCGQRLGETCLKGLQESLKNNTVLEELWLDNCKMDSGGLSILSSVLKKDSLKILSLNENGLGDDCLHDIVLSLSNVKSLNILCLDRNGISDSGCLHICHILAEADTTFTLSLVGNRISDSGAMAIAKVLECRSTTCILNLAENQIGIEGAKRLVQVWLQKGFSWELNLKSNQITRNAERGSSTSMLFENRRRRHSTKKRAARSRNGEFVKDAVLTGILLEDDSAEMITVALGSR